MKRVVHVVDDDDAVRSALENHLVECGFSVQQYASGRALLAMAGNLVPGCILLDLRMPEMSGFDVHSTLVRRGFDHPIVYLTAHGDVAAGVQAIKRGAVDFLEKPVREAALLAALEQAFRRYDARVEKQSAGEEARQRLEELTPRELEVIEHVVRGQRSRQIADALAITVQTVKVHRMRAMAKLGASTIPDLMRTWGAARSIDGQAQ